MSTALVWDERFAWHDAGRASSHPWVEPYPALDRPESKRRLRNLVEASGLLRELLQVPARPASVDALCRVHTREYVERVRRLSESGGGDAGESAYLGPGGYHIARLAAGGCIEAVDAVLAGRAGNAYALVRPCGHHAEADRGRGFCIFANVVVAVQHARQVHGLERIAVVDWDVHHGNGTEQAFYDDPGVLTVSLHQDRCYPVDSGGLDDTGAGAGRGFNLNLPLPPGRGNGAWTAALERVVIPMLEVYEPELVIVAAGYDAAASDPLGRMLCHSGTYREMTRQVRDAAARLCGGRLVVCHEGGYSPTYAPFCGLAVIETLAGVRTPVEDPLLAWYAAMGGQALALHQELLLERAEARVGALARALADPAGRHVA